MSTTKKNWTLPDSGYRKFIATAITYALSKELDRKLYEVVHEGNIDLHDHESATPDIIVYDKSDNYAPVLIIELCSNDTAIDTITTAEIIKQLYLLKEAFIYNTDTEQWMSCDHNHTILTSYSELFKLKLNVLLSKYLHRYI